MLTLDDVMLHIKKEISHQDKKWGTDKQQSLPGYILIMQKKIRDAQNGWCSDTPGRNSALSEMLQAVTVGIRCLQEYGVTGWAQATNDIPLEPQQKDKTIKLTLVDGSPLVVSKSIITGVDHDLLNNCAIVATNKGAEHRVRENVRQIQIMLQGEDH
jgi:hypothetical protein